jgi:type IV pilus assembly protein PilC
MAEYVVKLADERGRIQEQVQIAGSAEELRTRFLQAGYYVYSVRPRGMRGVGGSRKRANLEAFIIFNQQFLTLIRAGLPILGSLDMLVKGQKNPTFRAQLENVAARVRTGESLSAAFEAQGGFPLIYTTTLLAGERSGQLEDVLSRYLAFQRISLSFRKKLMASLLYPCLLITMVVALFVFLISFVVPRFAMLYDQLGTNLPAVTRMLLTVGNNFQHYILWVLAGFALIVYGLFRYSQTTAGAARIDRMRIGMPVFGNIWRKYQVALFVRTLSSLPGALARDSSALDLEQHHCQGGDGLGRDGARGKKSSPEPGEDGRLPRPGRGNDRCGRIDRSLATNAQFGCRVF